MNYADRAKIFAALHQPGAPVVIYNIWDAGSACVIAAAGAQAIASGSHPLAAAQGYDDGEKIPLERLLQTAKQIVDSTDLPVSIDFEGGYASAPEELSQNVARLAETGAIGLNFEDQIVGGAGLYDIKTQQARVAAVRAGHKDIFINARTDLFLKEQDVDKHDALVGEALERAAAYNEAGANCFFVPGLRNRDLLAKLCAESPLPVNAFMRGFSLEQARDAGAARASYGPIPHAKLMAVLEEHFKALD